MISQAVVYPLDTLKFRMQCETVVGGERGNKLIWHTAQKMWARNGLSAFYRGLPMGLMGMFPYAAIDLFMFETLKKTMIARNVKRKGVKHEEDALPGNFTLALMGGFSGAFGASIVYPLNLLRTRLQSQGTAGHPRTYTGIMDVTRQTLKHEGTRGLFKGLTPNLLKVVPAVSIVSLDSPLWSPATLLTSAFRRMWCMKTPRRPCICIKERGLSTQVHSSRGVRRWLNIWYSQQTDSSRLVRHNERVNSRNRTGCCIQPSPSMCNRSLLVSKCFCHA